MSAMREVDAVENLINICDERECEYPYVKAASDLHAAMREALEAARKVITRCRNEPVIHSELLLRLREDALAKIEAVLK